MRHTTPRRPLPALTAACLAALVFLPGATYAKLPEPSKDFWKEGQFYGVGSCQACHTTQHAPYKTDFVLLTEYTTWRSLDKHAQAYAALKTERGQQMGKILGVDVTKKEAGCLGCHSMSFTGNRTGENFNILDGVTCDGCHGPAEGWINLHVNQSREWRQLTGEEKERYGMRDVRNPVKKAEMCAACHVGNVGEGKVITHAMYAAGHPPLPAFEVETFCKNLPQHWRDRKDVPFLQKPPANIADKIHSIYHWDLAPVAQTQLTLAGGLTVLRAQMQVIAGRADFDAKTDRTQRWPELALTSFDLPKDTNPAQLWPDFAMSHSDCYACHHELVTPSWRQQRGYDLIFPGGKIVGFPGRVQVRRWPFALAGWGPGDVWGTPGADGKHPSAALAERVQALYQACNDQPYGDPARMRKAALDLGDWLKGPMDHLTGERLTASELPGLLQKLCSSPVTEYADYETARQMASAFRTVYREWDPNGDKAPGVNAVLDKLEEQLDVHPYIGRAKRLALIRAKLAKGSDAKLPSNEDLLKDLEATSSKEYKQVLKGENLDAFKRFLDALAEQPVQDLSEVLVSPASLKDINEIGNEELARSLNATNRYDPKVFRDSMAELAKLLGKKE